LLEKSKKNKNIIEFSLQDSNPGFTG